MDGLKALRRYTPEDALREAQKGKTVVVAISEYMTYNQVMDGLVKTAHRDGVNIIPKLAEHVVRLPCGGRVYVMRGATYQDVFMIKAMEVGAAFTACSIYDLHVEFVETLRMRYTRGMGGR